MQIACIVRIMLCENWTGLHGDHIYRIREAIAKLAFSFIVKIMNNFIRRCI